MSTSASPLEIPEEPKSFAARLGGVFIAPSATFADVVRKPDFVAPLIVSVLASVAMFESMLWKIGIERIMRQQIEHSSRASNMTPEQMQQAVEQGARFGGIITHLSAFLAVPIGALIVAGIGLLIASVIFGSPLPFKTAFSVTCYAGLVFVLQNLMAMALILFGDPEHFNPQNLVPSNVGFFLPSETSKPLMSLAGSFDIFTLWDMALLAIGFSEATARKAKSVSLFLTFFGVWMVWVLIKMGLATLF